VEAEQRRLFLVLLLLTLAVAVAEGTLGAGVVLAVVLGVAEQAVTIVQAHQGHQILVVAVGALLHPEALPMLEGRVDQALLSCLCQQFLTQAQPQEVQQSQQLEQEQF
tara:strand:- start:36 stop:359 length:324 start_codon:yes stop_codon:yes gene_type:complete